MDDLVSKFSECGYAVLREALSCEEITICRKCLFVLFEVNLRLTRY